jgi:hypothetical protein
MPQASFGMPQCLRYSPGTEAYAYCHRHHAHEMGSPEEAERLCPQAGDWEQDCRMNWVTVNSSPGSGYTDEQLHTLCAGNADCSLQVLDSRPAAIGEQLSLCHRWGGEFREDCAIHALQRWIHSSPTEAEFQTLRGGGLFVQQAAHFTATAVQCFGQGTCGDSGRFSEICSEKREYFVRNPERCPRPRKERGPDPAAKPPRGGAAHPPAVGGAR